MVHVAETITQLSQEYKKIPDSRRETLQSIASFVQNEQNAGRVAKLIFICTHNSRRSHIAQVWAQTAIAHFNIQNVNVYSGGTEATAFSERALKALQRLGFVFEKLTGGKNPHYNVYFSDTNPPLRLFSKRYDDVVNPEEKFAAIMTCAHAWENCPIVAGASIRIPLPYDDPKDFDGTIEESIKYEERVLEIGREMLFAFSKIAQ